MRVSVKVLQLDSLIAIHIFALVHKCCLKSSIPFYELLVINFQYQHNGVIGPLVQSLAGTGFKFAPDNAPTYSPMRSCPMNTVRNCTLVKRQLKVVTFHLALVSTTVEKITLIKS